jgi:hypothetical protein
MPDHINPKQINSIQFKSNPYALFLPVACRSCGFSVRALSDTPELVDFASQYPMLLLSPPSPLLRKVFLHLAEAPEKGGRKSFFFFPPHRLIPFVCGRSRKVEEPIPVF